ncbi:hypothetical protein PsorP6_007877 [Peronosclerospora sorghi]|uniref:Uncharacterized protein n=1 Tax=Peronosclerospora sorghi TaxID=230839 RepID=A0ACC0WAI4_9STRA|nr:hypothetical protein PsorP6_007877 [Peronosclerospora sorghi]
MHDRLLRRIVTALEDYLQLRDQRSEKWQKLGMHQVATLCLSEDSYPAAACSDCGYASDTARQRASGCSSLHRSVSRSSGCAAKRLYKGKRILELQDEDRRLHPDDRGAALSQSKRSKQ